MYARLTVLLCVIFFTTTSFAQQFSKRNQEWEATFMLKNQGSETINGPNNASVDFEEEFGWGFTIGYNFNHNLNLAFEFSNVRPRYEARFIDAENNPRSVKTKADITTANMNLSYFFGNGPIQPFVMGTIGRINTDSNVSTGKGYCVPDYNWGWYCYNSTYSDSDWGYGAAVGLRADLNPNMFVRGSYGIQQVDFGGSSSDPEYDLIRLELGWKLR